MMHFRTLALAFLAYPMLVAFVHAEQSPLELRLELSASRCTVGEPIQATVFWLNSTDRTVQIPLVAIHRSILEIVFENGRFDQSLGSLLESLLGWATEKPTTPVAPNGRVGWTRTLFVDAQGDAQTQLYLLRPGTYRMRARLGDQQSNIVTLHVSETPRAERAIVELITAPEAAFIIQSRDFVPVGMAKLVNALEQEPAPKYADFIYFGLGTYYLLHADIPDNDEAVRASSAESAWRYFALVSNRVPVLKDDAMIQQALLLTNLGLTAIDEEEVAEFTKELRLRQEQMPHSIFAGQRERLLNVLEGHTVQEEGTLFPR